MESTLVAQPDVGVPSVPAPATKATPWAWLLLPGGIFLLLLFVLPLVELVLFAFGSPKWTLSHFLRIGDNATYLIVLRTTLVISLTVTALSFLFAYPIAYALATAGKRLRTFLLIAVVLPYFTSVLARTFAWVVLLGRNGVVNETLLQLGLTSQPLGMMYNRIGVIIGLVHVTVPLMVLPMYTVMVGIDQKLVRAARANGASPVAAFLTVFLPLSLPGVVAGVLLAFISCLGSYITPALLGGVSDLTVTMEISSQVIEQLNWNFGSALSMVLLGLVLVTLWVGSRIFPIAELMGFSEKREAKSGESRHMGSQFLMRIGAAANALDQWMPSLGGRSVSTLATILAALLLLPVLIVAYLSFSSSTYFVFPPPGYSLHNYEGYFTDTMWVRSTLTSVRVALMAAAMATVLGSMLAFGLSRGNMRGQGLLIAIVISPIILPTIVVAIATYFVLVRVGLQGTEFGLALGHAVHAMPYVVVIVITNLRDLNPVYERAARSLGAGPLATFRTIIAPLVMPAFIVAGFFAFLGSFDDVVYVLFLGIGKITTMPMRMWEGIKQDISPTISAVATLEMVLAAVAIVVSNWLKRRRDA